MGSFGEGLEGVPISTCLGCSKMTMQLGVLKEWCPRVWHFKDRSHLTGTQQGMADFCTVESFALHILQRKPWYHLSLKLTWTFVCKTQERKETTRRRRRQGQLERFGWRFNGGVITGRLVAMELDKRKVLPYRDHIWRNPLVGNLCSLIVELKLRCHNEAQLLNWLHSMMHNSVLPSH
jgi:hypothetical protein